MIPSNYTDNTNHTSLNYVYLVVVRDKLIGSVEILLPFFKQL